MTSIEINKEISNLLNSISSGYTGSTKFIYYPLIAPENSELPIVIYSRSVEFTEFENYDNKIGVVTVDIDILTNNYADGITILTDINAVFALNNYEVSSISEDFQDNIFIQKIILNKIII